MTGEAERPDHLAVGELRRRIQEILECRVLGDVDGMLAHFSPHIVFHYASGEEGLFKPGILHGQAALRAHTRRTDIDHELLDAEIADMLVDGASTVVRWRSNWRNRGTGERCTIDMAHFLRWSQGVVVEAHEFLDRLSGVEPAPSSLLTLEEIVSPPAPGLSRGEMERRTKKLLTASASGRDLDAIRQLCAPDVVCEFVGDRMRIPYAGRHVGVEALVAIIRAVAVDFEQTNNVVAELLVDSGRVAGRRSVDWFHYGTGRHGRVELAGFARFEKGLIVEFVEYRDSGALLEMQGEMDQP